MLNKVKILVPLDQPDILGAAHEDTPPDYKLVFEESLNLAKALYAEVVLLHVASREDEESIRPSHERESDRPSPEALKNLRETGLVVEIDNLIESYLPKLELTGYAGVEVKNRKDGRSLEFEIDDETEAGLRELFIAGKLKVPDGKGFYDAVEDLLRDWSLRLTSQLQEPIQDLLTRFGGKSAQIRAMILMMDVQGRVICKAAQAWDMDLIVIGRGKAAGWRSLWSSLSILFDVIGVIPSLLDFGNMSLWFDSVSNYVLHNASCSVALVDEHLKEVPKIEKILVALDYSPTSREIFLQAVNLAERIRAVKKSLNPNIADKDATPTLCLLHVTSPFEQGDLQIVRSFAAWAEERNVPVQYAQKPALTVKEYLTEVVLQPDALPGQVICEVAVEWGADLIVLGYRREWELKKLVLGSVCNYVTRHAPCSVFVVRSFKPLDTSEIELTYIKPEKEKVTLPTN
jgi:nucleotide-binding universal stress UspA family protein